MSAMGSENSNIHYVRPRKLENKTKFVFDPEEVVISSNSPQSNAQRRLSRRHHDSTRDGASRSSNKDGNRQPAASSLQNRVNQRRQNEIRYELMPGVKVKHAHLLYGGSNAKKNDSIDIAPGVGSVIGGARSSYEEFGARSRQEEHGARSRQEGHVARSRQEGHGARSRHEELGARSRHEELGARSRNEECGAGSRHEYDELGARSRYEKLGARSRHEELGTGSRHEYDELGARSRYEKLGARSRHEELGARSRYEKNAAPDQQRFISQQSSRQTPEDVTQSQVRDSHPVPSRSLGAGGARPIMGSSSTDNQPRSSVTTRGISVDKRSGFATKNDEEGAVNVYAKDRMDHVNGPQSSNIREKARGSYDFNNQGKKSFDENSNKLRPFRDLREKLNAKLENQQRQQQQEHTRSKEKADTKLTKTSDTLQAPRILDQTKNDSSQQDELNIARFQALTLKGDKNDGLNNNQDFGTANVKIKKCICLRPLKIVFCERCMKSVFGRIMRMCQVHSEDIYLMDMKSCGECRSESLIEYDIPDNVDTRIIKKNKLVTHRPPQYAK